MGKLAARPRLEKTVAYAASAMLLVAVWATFSSFLDPIILPSPLLTAQTAWEMFRTGSLEYHMLVSYLRIFVAWLLGSALGTMMGLALGRIFILHVMLNPMFEFVRFIPPISFVTLFIIWLGIGEVSKVALITYTTLFIVAVNVSSGAVAVRKGHVRAARSLGASAQQVFFSIVVPCCVPYIITGMRLAMGSAFMTIVAAEILAAKAGVGHLIWKAQEYMQTDQVFVGFAALCFMGFTTDVLLQSISRRYLSKYGTTTA